MDFIDRRQSGAFKMEANTRGFSNVSDQKK